MHARPLLALLVCLSLPPALAGDPPDSAIDPATGFIHTVDAAPSGSDHVIRHTLDPGMGQPTAVAVTSGHDDFSPRVAIGSGSAAWVVYWRGAGTDEVRAIRRASDGSFGTDRRLSEAAEGSRHPEIVLFGGQPWVVYAIPGGQTSIAVLPIVDEPDPVGPRVVLAATSFAEGVDARIHAAGGTLWVTWIEGEEDLGWSVYATTTESWSSPSYQEVLGQDYAAAREHVEAIVTGD